MRQVYRPRALAWLDAVVLPPAAAATGRRLTHLLRTLQDEVSAAEAALRAPAQQDPIAMALDQLVGIGPVLALALRAEIGDIARFGRGPQLAS